MKVSDDSEELSLWVVQVTTNFVQVQEETGGASLVVQWWRLHLPVQETWVQSLILEGPTCLRAMRPMRHNYWAWALELGNHNCWAHVPQLQKKHPGDIALQQEKSL